MMTLYDLGNDIYRIQAGAKGSTWGTLKEVVQFAYFQLDISPDEIEYGLIAMNALGHDMAEYGVMGTFIYSQSSKEIKHVG